MRQAQLLQLRRLELRRLEQQHGTEQRCVMLQARCRSLEQVPVADGIPSRSHQRHLKMFSAMQKTMPTFLSLLHPEELCVPQELDQMRGFVRSVAKTEGHRHSDEEARCYLWICAHRPDLIACQQHHLAHFRLVSFPERINPITITWNRLW